MTFYEVRAKSIINKVAAGSRVPFQWTVNPYRGCSHACAYCLSPDTPVLMADGRTRPIRDLRVGDRVYGTVREGRYRRYRPTTVLAHWSTVKRAYRVVLSDGTALVASGDHRFLTERGWKHVTAGTGGARQRACLTTNNKILGVGSLGAAPKDSPDYRRGYLTGMIRGDGLLRAYRYPSGVIRHFRLALADAEALDRTRAYLADAGVPTRQFVFASARGDRKEMRAIRNQTASGFAAISRLIAWPDAPGADWHAGFLAGIFDAEGSHSTDGVLRMSSKDPRIIERTVAACDALGFATALHPPKDPGRATHVRLLGGLGARLRFLQAVDPAISRKRTIDGSTVKSTVRLGVVSIEDLGVDIPMYDITTGTGDFVADGMISHNCFARRTHEYLDLDSGRDFDTQIVVKVNAGELLRRELSAPRWSGGHIAMGTNVDCYQRAEGRYRLMPPILEALRDFANPFSILTKGTLILRDLPLLVQAARVTTVGLSMSIGFLDEQLWRSVEPGTPSPRRRLDAVRALTDAGFEVGVLMAPLLPGLTDDEDSIDDTVRAIAAAGAASITPIPLHLRPGAREWYKAWLAREHPELAATYRRRFGAGSYLAAADQSAMTGRVRAAALRHGIAPSGTRAARASQPADEREEPRYEQLTLL